jgi:hypothetical protein
MFADNVPEVQPGSHQLTVQVVEVGPDSCNCSIWALSV